MNSTLQMLRMLL